MKKLIIAFCATAFPFAALADDPNSKAKNWNLVAQKKAIFTGKVVDVRCEVTGNCADECGAGAYHLGILTTDGKLIPTMKNGQTSFNGTTDDLLPYCGQDVQVDGLLVGEGIPEQYYQVQLIKAGDGDWKKANLHTKTWKKKYPDAGGKGPWFRRDPRVKAQLEKDGWLGLGADVDKKFIAENY